MKHALLTIAQMMLASSKQGDYYDTVASVADIVMKAENKEAAIPALADLAYELIGRDRDAKERTPESDERAYAWNFVHAMIGLLQVDNGSKMAFLPLYAFDTVATILDGSVQKVHTNQGRHRITRFYTESGAEENWEQVHHLIDLDARGGYNYNTLSIHEFSIRDHEPTSVQLTHNETEELLTVVLTSRIEEGKKRWEEAEAERKRDIERGASKSTGDFDPFLDSDDLP